MSEEIEHFWTAVSRGWDIEPREYFEREAVRMGFKSPVEMAVHHMWKRRVNESSPAPSPLVGVSWVDVMEWAATFPLRDER